MNEYDTQVRDRSNATCSGIANANGEAVTGSGSEVLTTQPTPDCSLIPAPSPISIRINVEADSNIERENRDMRVKRATPESGIVSRLRELRQQSSCNDSSMTRLLPTPYREPAHLQRSSGSSSGFVHSMKTASFTNASVNIVSRSVRIGRSTDSQNIRGSQPRYSIDSDRPISSSSFDEVTLRRGFKRQQIIDELIATEETYICDLKALIYLYSTLLASTSSIPNKVRASIERNVASILQIHEEILAKLHEARLRAAARRWADTEVLVRVAHQRRSHLRRSERDARTRHPMFHRRVRSSVDSTDTGNLRTRHSGSAEPIDVSEIAIILRLAIKQFYVYEEYCANFEIIGHELQKHNPQLWPAYESGIESLARVVMAIDQRQTNHRRGLTVGDLLIKPIQRLTKYPLLLEQLLTNTPVVDAPSTHAELERVLQFARDIVQTVNLARENPYTRHEIQRRWLLLDRLDLSKLAVTTSQFRDLGSVELCGVLHVAYQTTEFIAGCYALCALLDEHFLIALPVSATGKFSAMAIIQLSDIKLEAPTDGKGLQCASTCFTWKISFACNGHYHELILSGCSKTEENIWTAGLRGDFTQPTHCSIDGENSVITCTALNLKSVGVVFSSQKSLSRESSVQRAATVGGRSSISPVIVRNTHNTHDIPEFQISTSSISPINRSQSHMNTKRIPVLEPKRSERTRLENRLSDIWTKERLPFPGMVGSRGGQIIRASAGSLARKLSLASIHSTFSRGRASSLSLASRKSYDLFSETISTLEVRRLENENLRRLPVKPRDVPEVDDMRSVVDRMIGVSLPGSRSDEKSGDVVVGRSRSGDDCKGSFRTLGADDPATIFYEGSTPTRDVGQVAGNRIGSTETVSAVSIERARRRRKRWSKHWPIDKLKEFGSEARGMFYSSSSSGT